MLLPGLALPAVATVGISLVALALHRAMRPAVAAFTYAALAAAAAVTVAATVVLVSLTVLGRVPGLQRQLTWCASLAEAHELPLWIGVSVVAALVAMALSTGRTLRRIIRVRRPASAPGVVVLPSDLPTAYAVPGRPGHVVISRGMLRQLSPEERRVVLAHEAAHLTRRHHRYVWAADLASAALPVLRPLRQRVRYATERWADEDAVDHVGDRMLVARAISRAALVQHDALVPGVLGVAGPSVPARVDALLADHRPPPSAAMAALAAAGLALVLGVLSSSLQLHHLAVLAEHVCGVS